MNAVSNWLDWLLHSETAMARGSRTATFTLLILSFLLWCWREIKFRRGLKEREEEQYMLDAVASASASEHWTFDVARGDFKCFVVFQTASLKGLHDLIRVQTRLVGDQGTLEELNAIAYKARIVVPVPAHWDWHHMAQLAAMTAVPHIPFSAVLVALGKGDHIDLVGKPETTDFGEVFMHFGASDQRCGRFAFADQNRNHAWIDPRVWMEYDYIFGGARKWFLDFEDHDDPGTSLRFPFLERNLPRYTPPVSTPSDSQ